MTNDPRTITRLCAAHGCGHPVQRPSNPRCAYCVSHQGLVYRFHQWLDGNDVLSFDRDRAGYESGHWHVV